jgi:hypothetical protein
VAAVVMNAALAVVLVDFVQLLQQQAAAEHLKQLYLFHFQQM